VQSPTSFIPRQREREAGRGIRQPSVLAGRHVLLVTERSAQHEGSPAPDDIVRGLRAGGARVAVLDCYNTIADLVGHRITGRPDVVIGVLPGRGPALAAVRAAERLGSPLVALVTHDGPASWGEQSTVRRATRVVITDEELRPRVEQAGAGTDRVDVWQTVTPTAMRGLETVAQRAITQHRRRRAGVPAVQ